VSVCSDRVVTRAGALSVPDLTECRFWLRFAVDARFAGIWFQASPYGDGVLLLRHRRRVEQAGAVVNVPWRLAGLRLWLLQHRAGIELLGGRRTGRLPPRTAPLP